MGRGITKFRMNFNESAPTSLTKADVGSGQQSSSAVQFADPPLSFICMDGDDVSNRKPQLVGFFSHKVVKRCGESGRTDLGIINMWESNKRRRSIRWWENNKRGRRRTKRGIRGDLS